ncbi:MAG: hypothetical protein IJW32_06080 [Clostridia bacterium]|nr:hypothetical protein [Alphaproteobacteria bacterium]MBQ9792566.1 hypothetical protein [Clostridia bacterium]MBQ9793282.1 hypothetical protein [Clostridia bacterium]
MKNENNEEWLRNSARLFNKLSGKKFTYSLYMRMEELRDRCEPYIDAYRDGKVKINENNAHGWALFIDAFAIGGKDKLLDDLQMKVDFDVKEYIAKEKKSFWNNLFVKKNTKHKHKKGKVKNKIKKVWSKWGSKIKTAIVSSVIILGGIGIAKSCDDSDKNDNLIVNSNKTSVKKDSVGLDVVAWKEVAVDSVRYAEAQKHNLNKEDSIDVKYQKIWNNFYDIRVEMFSSSKEKDNLYAKIDKQIKDGFLELKDGISKERVAYCYLIYKEYGIKSSIKDVIFADKKVDSSTLELFYDDIMSAGEKGLGVKEKAQKQNKNGLTNYSKLDRASSNLKMKSVKNLKELRDFKKMYKNM